MFAKGDEVLARHPERNEYSSGKITEIKGSKYKIKFYSGEEHVVSETDVRSKRVSRSSTRMSAKARKSPSRASPGRRRSPGRKSPSRVKKTSPVLSTKYAKVAIARIDLQKVDYADETSTTDATDSLEGSDVMPLQSRLKELRPMLRRSTRIQGNALTESSLKGLTNRASSLPIERNIIKEGKERGLSMQKDLELLKLKQEDDKLSDIGSEKYKLEISFITKYQEWGGQFGTLFLLFLLPAAIILPQFACSSGRCKSTYFNVPKNWNVYLNFNAFLLYFGYVFSIGLLSVLPIGKYMDGQQTKIGTLHYRQNGLLSAIFLLCAFGICIFKGYKIHNFVLEQSISLSICGWLMGTIFALVLYVKSNRVPISHHNMYASTNNVIYDFWQGREINPRLKSVDFKIMLLRSSVIGSIVINIAAAVKVVEKINAEFNNGGENISIHNVDVTTLISVLLQIIYLFDFLLFESSFLTTFEVLYEGMGYMLCVGYLLAPFLMTLPTRYLLYNTVNFTIQVTLPCIVFFFIGYTIYRMSNLQKDKFRKNPFVPSLSHLQTISTSRGKKLMVSGLWGYVRHPNYLGNIILHWSIACLTLSSDILLYYAAILYTLTLMYRAIRDNARCTIRYEMAWDQYCSQVKYMILKHIF